MTEKSNHGGKRPNQTGRPPLPPNQKRQQSTVKLAPSTKALAQAIAKSQGLSGWGKLLDQLVQEEAKRLGITLDNLKENGE